MPLHYCTEVDIPRLDTPFSANIIYLREMPVAMAIYDRRYMFICRIARREFSAPATFSSCYLKTSRLYVLSSAWWWVLALARRQTTITNRLSMEQKNTTRHFFSSAFSKITRDSALRLTHAQPCLEFTLLRRFHLSLPIVAKINLCPRQMARKRRA